MATRQVTRTVRVCDACGEETEELCPRDCDGCGAEVCLTCRHETFGGNAWCDACWKIGEPLRAKVRAMNEKFKAREDAVIRDWIAACQGKETDDA